MSEPTFMSAFVQAATGEPAASPKADPTPATPAKESAASEKAKEKAVTQEVSKPDVSKTSSGQVELVTKKGKYFEMTEPVKDEPAKDDAATDKKPDPASDANVATKADVKADEPKTNPELRKLYEATLKENKELKSRMPTADPSEIEALKKERDEALKTIERIRVEEHPNFQKQFVAPLEKTIAKVKQLVDPSVAGNLEVLLRRPASGDRLNAIEKAIEDLSPARQAEVLRLAGSAADIVEAKESALSESRSLRSSWEQSEQIRERESLQKQTESVKGVVDDVLDEASKAFELLRENDDPVHNRKVSERMSQARELLFGKLSADEVAKAAVWSVIGREAQPLLAAAHQRIASLSAELEKIKTTRPLGGSAHTSGQSAKPMNAIEAMKTVWSGG